MRLLRGEVQIVEQFAVLVHARVVAGQETVSVEDRVGSGEEGQRLGFAGERAAPGGEAHFGAGQGDAGGGDEPHELKDVHGGEVGQLRAGHRDQAVDGRAFRQRVEVGQHFEQFEPVGFGLAHADDPAATKRHPGFPHGGNGVEPVLVGVGGDDLGVKLGRGIEVVVVGGDAGFLELAGFDGGQVAEGDADFDAELGDVADDVQDMLELGLAVADAAPGRAHAEPGGAVVDGCFGCGHDLAFFHQRGERQFAAVAGALGAVAAVFGAAARLDRQERAELDLIHFPMFQVDAAGLLDEGEKGLFVDALKLG